MTQFNPDTRQQYTSIDKLPDMRSDGQRLNSPLSLYNHDSPDIAYQERLAEEVINLTGAWITVFKRTRDTGKKDEIWDEDADPTYSAGKTLKGKFAPAPAEATLTNWGVDTKTELTIHFPRSVILREFGKKMITEGDILVVPHNTLAATQSTDLRDGPANRIDRFRVVKASDTQVFKYRWLYWSCLVQNITGDKSLKVEHDLGLS